MCVFVVLAAWSDPSPFAVKDRAFSRLLTRLPNLYH